MDKRLKGLKENPVDIGRSIVKRALGISEKEALRRLDICRECPSNVEDKMLGGRMCSECFCNLKNLAYSKKGCELKKW
jgi:hypothetical protein